MLKLGLWVLLLGLGVAAGIPIGACLESYRSAALVQSKIDIYNRNLVLVHFRMTECAVGIVEARLAYLGIPTN